MLEKQDFIKTAKLALAHTASAILSVLFVLTFCVLLIGSVITINTRPDESQNILIGMMIALTFFGLVLFWISYRLLTFIESMKNYIILTPEETDAQCIFYEHTIPIYIIFILYIIINTLTLSPGFVLYYSNKYSTNYLFFDIILISSLLLLGAIAGNFMMKKAKIALRRRYADRPAFWTNKDGLIVQKIGLIPWKNIDSFKRRRIEGFDIISLEGRELP